MDSGLVGATAAVLGSLVGGSASVATAWLTQRTQGRREVLLADLGKRETLYGEFIAESAKRLVEAFTKPLESPENLLTLYALINRIRLAASGPVLTEAERLLTHITEQYFASNLTLEEMRNLARAEGEDADPLKPFGEACRAELAMVRAQM